VTMTISPLEQELSRLLEARSGHFQFESGHHGNLWLDLDALFLYPSRLEPFIAELAMRFAKYKVQSVCGPLVGGAFLAQSLAIALHVEFSFAERCASAERSASSSAIYRIPNGLRATLHGKRVAIVDDAINAGSAVRGTLTDLQFCGANPVVVGALLVLGNAAVRLSAEHDIPVESIAQLPSNLWAPSKCPLCASQTPLENALDEARPG
jgi:orotate phosphoribosyltransferase